MSIDFKPNERESKLGISDSFRKSIKDTGGPQLGDEIENIVQSRRNAIVDRNGSDSESRSEPHKVSVISEQPKFNRVRKFFQKLFNTKAYTDMALAVSAKTMIWIADRDNPDDPSIKEAALVSVPQKIVDFEDGGLIPNSVPLDRVQCTNGGVTAVAEKLIDPLSETVALHNYYKTYVKNKEGQLVNTGLHRSGVIDTPEKFDDWMLFVQGSYDERLFHHNIDLDENVVRVVQLQLNSFGKLVGSENRLIEDEHYLSAKKNLEGGAQIVHINLPSNRWYYLAKKLGKTASDFLLGSEKRSKEQNLEGWATYTKWMKEDFQKLLNSANDLPQEIRNKLRLFIQDPIHIRIEENQKKIFEQIANGEKVNPATRHALKKDLKFVHAMLEKILTKKITTDTATPYTEVYPDNKTVLELYEKCSVFHEILGSQLDLAEISRDKEQKLLLLLNSKMQMNSDQNVPVEGIITTVNCKTGADRTGFFHASGTSFHQLSQIYSSSQILDLFDHWDETAVFINKFIANQGIEKYQEWVECIKKCNEYEKLSVEFEKTKVKFEKLQKEDPQSVDPNQILKLKKYLKRTEDTLNAGKHKYDENIVWLQEDHGGLPKLGDPLLRRIYLAHEYRSYVLNNLIQMGLPITADITGFAGLKWGRGLLKAFKENLLPLNSIPSHIEVIDEKGHKQIVQLVRYDVESGNPLGLTEIGFELITKFSNLREH